MQNGIEGRESEVVERWRDRSLPGPERGGPTPAYLNYELPQTASNSQRLGL